MSSAPSVLGAIFAFGALMSSSTPDGERVQQLVYDWLNRNYPEGPTWYATSATSLALEIRMISAFDDIEYNLANGGWAQFLWNCFDYWRSAIEGAKEGYLLIGAPEQSAALETLRTLCERDERECEALLERSEAEFDEDRYGSPPVVCRIYLPQLFGSRQ
jgi:hypothetical protein